MNFPFIHPVKEAVIFNALPILKDFVSYKYNSQDMKVKDLYNVIKNPEYFKYLPDEFFEDLKKYNGIP